jgi:hypothetical protein
MQRMWMLRNTTPFAAETSWIRDERGAEFWLVAVRACFEIDQQGRQSPAAKQTEVQRAPSFASDPLRSGLLCDSDFALHKDGTDVLVEGRAYAPEGRPTTNCSLRLIVGTVDKSVNVVGERRISKCLAGLSMSSPEPFLNMPLTWSRTYGGWDCMQDKQEWEPSNPVGKGFAIDPLHLDGSEAPNFEYPGAPFRGPRSGRPAAFGPVAHHWHPRLRYGGTYDKQWQQTRDPLLPTDFDRRYFRCAPEDQQTQKPLIGYEDVRLGGMTADGFLGFVLPRISFNFITTFRRYGDVQQTPSIHTLWLMPDRRRFEIVYVSALEVPPGREEKLVGTTVLVRRRLGASSSILRSGVWNAD